MPDFSMLIVKSKNSLDKNQIELSQAITGAEVLKKHLHIKLSVGHKNTSLAVKVIDSKKNEIYLSPSVISNLKLSTDEKTAYRIYDNSIKIGPVVGIMADTFPDKKKPFACQNNFIKQLLIAGKNIGQICYAFSSNNIDWKREGIYAYIYENNRWKRRWMQFPDVVYPRERGFSSNKMSIRRKLENFGCKFINPPLIGKWKTFQIVSKNEKLVKYIPDTRLIKSSKEIDKMIKLYEAVYLKPSNGSQGKDIIQVVKKNKFIYEYQYQSEDQYVKGSANSFNNLLLQIRKIMGTKTYIIQKEIKLLRYKGSIVDLRILVQKEHNAIWQVTGQACRIGKNGSITSNISTGGSGKSLDYILIEHFSDQEQRERIKQEINYLALEAARNLDNAVGPIGELGIDIGIDNKGGIWFIEANLKPARQIFVLIGETETRKRSVENPLLYSRYLAGFRED